MKKSFCDICECEIPQHVTNQFQSLRNGPGPVITLDVFISQGGPNHKGDFCAVCTSRILENAAKKLRGEPLDALGPLKYEHKNA